MEHQEGPYADVRPASSEGYVAWASGLGHVDEVQDTSVHQSIVQRRHDDVSGEATPLSRYHTLIDTS